MKFSIDRLEGGQAVCVAFGGEREMSGFVFSLDAALFPDPPEEGAVYFLKLEPDYAESERRYKRAKDKLNRLFKKEPHENHDKHEKGEEKI